MPENVTNELLYEVLKQGQAGQAEMKATLGDVVTQLIRVREDINNLRSDDLRRERVQAQNWRTLSMTIGTDCRANGIAIPQRLSRNSVAPVW